MANVGQGEIGDPHGVEGILSPHEEDDYPEVTFVGMDPLVMTAKKMMMPPQTVKMAMGAHIYLQHLEVVQIFWNLTDLEH